MTDTPITQATVRQWGQRQYALVPLSLAAVGDDVMIVRGHAPEGLAAAGDGTYYGPPITEFDVQRVLVAVAAIRQADTGSAG